MGMDLQAAVTDAFVALADVVGPLNDAGWDTPSLCEGWRVREVVAHLTMPVRYDAQRFMAELEECDGDFTELSNRVAARDAALPTDVLVAGLRDDAMHRWTPPGGGQAGALSHVVIHGLDVTVPLGVGRVASDEAVRSVLDGLTAGGAHNVFGVDLSGLALRATDLDWGFGAGGAPVTGSAGELVLLLSGRRTGLRAG
jgi:uncharacterized protein (TIGR03083 family)